MQKKRYLFFLSFLLVIITLLILFGDNGAQKIGNWVAIENGQALYKQNCMSCHGVNGVGPRVGNATSLNNQEFLNAATDQFLFETITRGRRETQMPAFSEKYGGTLRDDEIKNIILYLRQWQTETIEMPTPSTVGVGDPQLGRKLYEMNCATCHGITARGELDMGPSLVNPDFLNAASDEFLWDTIAYGRSGTPMGPSLKGRDGVRQLSEQEINDIIAYLKKAGTKNEAIERE